MTFKIIYDDEADTLQFEKDDFTVCTTSVEAFNSVYSRNFSSLQSALLPPAVRQIGRFGDKTFIFYEERPQYRQVQFTPEKLEKLNLNNEGTYNYFLPMPWLLYVIELSMGNEINEIYGYIIRRSPTFAQSTLYQIPIHNWYSKKPEVFAPCSLCRPMYNDESINKHADLLSVINQVHAEVWTSGFNNDLRDTVDQYISRAPHFSPSFLAPEHVKGLRGLANADSTTRYNYYYTAWANASMDQMVNATYFKLGQLGDLWGHALGSGSQMGIESSQFTSEVLIAAQNASMIGR